MPSNQPPLLVTREVAEKIVAIVREIETAPDRRSSRVVRRLLGLESAVPDVRDQPPEWLPVKREDAENALDLMFDDGALHTDDDESCDVCQRVTEARRLLGLAGDH